AGITRRGLHKNMLESRAALQCRDQQSVQSQASGQAQVSSLPRHANRNLLDSSLDSGRQRGAQTHGNGDPVLQSQPRIKLRAETSVRQTLGIEERAVHPRPFTITGRKNFKEKFPVAIVALSREPLHLVLLQVSAKSQQLGHSRIEVAKRVRVIHLAIKRNLCAGRLPSGTAAKVSGA